MPIEVRELESHTAKDGTRIRCFALTAKQKQVTVELCSIGAAIHKILVPNYNDDSSLALDNVVLGYKTLLDLHESRNPPYLGVIVGRVANRVQHGRFHLNNTNQEYQLNNNNGPNHLHGGNVGFSHQNWNATILDGVGVEFSLVSDDGDEEYPGRVQVKAVYSLVEKEHVDGATLTLTMTATLLSTDKSSPINLAQHSYFNLAGHDCPDGILEHSLYMPHAIAYTPVDSTWIPTRKVQLLKNDACMDFATKQRLLKDALVDYGVYKAGLTKEQATENLQRAAPALSSAGHSTNPNEPYGFDHNYVLTCPSKHDDNELKVAGIIEHAGTKRRLTVKTNAPGVQLYTGNWLDGSTTIGTHMPYKQWQGLCLETQAYPSSIMEDENNDDDDDDDGEFAKGKCFILKPGGPDYHHVVEYHFEKIK